MERKRGNMNTEKITVKLKQPRRQTRLAPFWCASCTRLVTMISFEEAACFFRVRGDRIDTHLDNRNLHWITTATGRLMVCQNSLIA